VTYEQAMRRIDKTSAQEGASAETTGKAKDAVLAQVLRKTYSL
jgi:hypothetical protein